jgi:hypothetical protein
VLTTDPADPRRPVHPCAATPRLDGVALRRTTSIEMLRPEGLDGRSVVVGRARDLVVGDRTAPRSVTASLELETPSLSDASIRSVHAAPWHPALASLVGSGASAGFRARLPEVLRDEPTGSLLWRLCTEVPNLYVIGGFPSQHEGVPLGPKIGHMQMMAGVCAGWRVGGTMLAGIERDGVVPAVAGPAAPPVNRDDEPLGWHDEPEMPIYAVRRRRRLDLHTGGASAQVWFRDTYRPPTGPEMVIHEYTLDLVLGGDPVAMTAVEVTAHVLPWGECPTAMASPQRLVGEPLATIAVRGRRELHGETTCTHLNACVGSIADLDALRSLLSTTFGG